MQILDRARADRAAKEAKEAMEKAEEEKAVKLDRDATLLHTVGGTSSESYGADPKTGRPFWKATSKSPCVWHFNTPQAADEMRPMIKKYPKAFV